MKSSFIWDCQESYADTCLKKIAHFFLIYNGFPLPVLPGRSIQHSPLPENSGLMIPDAA